MSEHETEPMPRWWWLNPWTFAIGQWEARDRHYAKYLEFSKAYGQANVELFNLKKEIQSQPKNKWLPIKTAPKDGTYILTYDKNLEVVISWFGKDLFKEDYEGWLYGDGNDLSVGCYYTPCEPTHWMPLPKPPAQ